MLKTEARRGASGQASGDGGAAHVEYSDEPLALQVFKRNKLCTVAKLTFFNDDSDERILAIAHDKQHGVKSCISVPLVVLDFAEARNVRYLYFRRDTTGEMFCIPLRELRRVGILQKSDGVLERFVKIAQMQPVTWRRWLFAPQVVVLSANNAQDDKNVQQLDLFSGAR